MHQVIILKRDEYFGPVLKDICFKSRRNPRIPTIKICSKIYVNLYILKSNSFVTCRLTDLFRVFCESAKINPSIRCEIISSTPTKGNCFKKQYLNVQLEHRATITKN
jgi:hypothetical protein